jgi:DNA-binding CsgD family transcriptional regulator
MLAKVGEATKLFDLIDRDDVLKGHFFAASCRPQPYNGFIGAILSRQLRRLQAVAFVRLDDQGQFDAEDLARLQEIVPHIARAVEVGERLNTLEDERRDVLAAIDSLSVGMLIVDGRRRLRQVNVEALRLLFDGGSMSVVYPQSMPAWSGGDVLKARFGFTMAELRVLLLLMEGGTRESAAADLGLSLATVKTQLQALFRKTGGSRQSDPIRQAMGAMAAPAAVGAAQQRQAASPG